MLWGPRASRPRALSAGSVPSPHLTPSFLTACPPASATLERPPHRSPDCVGIPCILRKTGPLLPWMVRPPPGLHSGGLPSPPTTTGHSEGVEGGV